MWIYLRIIMAKKNQSSRLSSQHKLTSGVTGIFGDEAKYHDDQVAFISELTLRYLEEKYPTLQFRLRPSVSKKEINSYLQSIDEYLGQTLYLEDSYIKPDGGLIEVKDDSGNWRVVLVSEAKHQGKDIENIEKGLLVGKNKDQDLMAAGNAIERSHKNISEIANFMLRESYFPYVLFLEGSNFLTHDITIKRPDGREVYLKYNSGTLNRLDRLTSANYGMPINTNLCINRAVSIADKSIMLQAASIYTSENGRSWEDSDMYDVMKDIAETSLKMLGRDLFYQLTSR